jgi:hypothetical protein
MRPHLWMVTGERSRPAGLSVPETQQKNNKHDRTTNGNPCACCSYILGLVKYTIESVTGTWRTLEINSSLPLARTSQAPAAQ